MFFVMRILFYFSRKITLWTGVFNVYMCQKTKPVCCIKTREREKGREKEKETDLKLEKLSSRLVEPLVGLALNMSLTIKLTTMLA